MVRPGIGLYGGIRNNGLKEVIQIKVPVLQDFIIDKNMQVGYNFTYKAKHKMRVATLAMGYADGLPRTLSNMVNYSMKHTMPHNRSNFYGSSYSRYFKFTQNPNIFVYFHLNIKLMILQKTVKPLVMKC